MKYIRTLTVLTDAEITQKEVPLFRGAVIQSLGEHPNVYFHNHLGDERFRYAYPLIQYKRIGGKAAIVCVEDGVDIIGQFLTEVNGTLNIGNRQMSCHTDKLQPARILVQTWEEMFSYHISRWLPLNSTNYQLYKDIEGVVEKASFLENILKANLLSMLKGLDIHLEKELILKLTEISDSYLLYYKGVKMMAFNADFKCNLSIPNNVGIGKNASIGCGIVRQQRKDNNNHSNQQPRMDKTHVFNQLFVGGDLSGIQRFLYNISSKKAAVSLKGRSFYLRQLMENVCADIKQAVEANGAKTAEVIYSSGGKFYLLTDNTPQIVQAVETCAKQAKQELWDEHKGQLGLNISHVAFRENPDDTVDCQDAPRQKPGYLWKMVNADFAHQKSQKFKELLTESYQDFFEPIPVGGKPKVCAVTGIESPDCVKMSADGKDGEMYVLPSVRQQIQLGEELRRQEGFKTFEEYAGDTNLGILRMDVDGLGKRFITGFDSISQYKTFSKRLVDFFERETGKIQQEPDFKPYLNIIYAGGDDLFVVGRWDKVIDFAERIHQETNDRFGSDGISISGGIAVVQPKFPIAKAAELAGEAEDAAKHFRDGEKNAFCMLGKTVSWKQEFDYVKSFKQQFVSFIESYGLSKGILHKLMLYSSIADRNKLRRKEGKAEDFSYIWHISYYLTRFMKRYESNQTVCDFCQSLRDKEIDYRNGRKLELIALAARWAELVLKDNINN